MDQREDTRRRIRAARVLAGLERVEDLATKIDTPGLGRDTLYNIEAGKRAVRAHELRLIAEACGLPYEFFTTDFAALGQSTDDEGRTLEQRIEAIESSIDTLVSVEARVARIELERRQERERAPQAGGDTPRTGAPGRPRRRRAS